jgi:hypothetical protein
VLLADFFSGVRIGEERWNVLRGKAVTGAPGVSFEPSFSVKSIFRLFLIPLVPAFAFYASASLYERPAPTAILAFSSKACGSLTPTPNL